MCRQRSSTEPCLQIFFIYFLSTKVRVVDRDAFKPYVKEMPKHKKNQEVGNKLTTYSSELYLEFADAKALSVGEEVNPTVFILSVSNS